MKLLIIGGTALLGRSILEHAVEAGHDVTVVNRTQLDRTRFNTVEWVDARVSEIDRIAGRAFDAVIDLSATTSNITLRTALSLSDRVKHYTLVSSISVYRDFATSGIDENYPVAELPAGVEERAEDFGTYGARMALCERRMAEVVRRRGMIVRAGLLAGPFDISERLPRLIRRVMQGGQVLMGGSASQPVQMLDVRDLAEWILARAESATAGAFNAVGDETSLGEVADAIAAATGSAADFVYANDDYLAQQGMQPMNQLPLWVPQRGFGGFFRVSNATARAAGLFPRPMSETIAATVAWLNDQERRGTVVQMPQAARVPTAALSRAAEQKLIDDHKRAGNGKMAAVN